MASTYSPILRTELIGAGDQPGSWGGTTNNNFQYVFETAIAGYQAVTVSPTSNNQVLTYVNGPSATPSLNQSIYAVLKLNAGTLGANFNIFAPPVSKTYTVWNNTAYTATFYNSSVIGNTTAAGSGVTIPAGMTTSIWSDGTNFFASTGGTPSNFTVTGNASVGGTLSIGGTSSFTGTSTFTGIANFQNSLAIGGGIATGLYGDNTNVAIRGYSTGSIYFQPSSGSVTWGTIGSSGLTLNSGSFSGAGTGLTGTASGLSIGGSAATVTTTVSSGAVGTTQAAGTNNTQLATTAFVTTAVSNAFPSGTRLPFAQSSAPTGWTQDTSDNATNRMLRVVNTAGNGVGGSASPILMDVVPSHTHTVSSSGTTSTTSINHSHTFSGTSSGQSVTHSHSVSDPGHGHSFASTFIYNVPSGGQINIRGDYNAVRGDYTNPVLNNAYTGISLGDASADHSHTYSGTTSASDPAHNHTVTVSGTTAANGSASNWAPRYIDLIICAKN